MCAGFLVRRHDLHRATATDQRVRRTEVRRAYWESRRRSLEESTENTIATIAWSRPLFSGHPPRPSRDTANFRETLHDSLSQASGLIHD